MNDLQWFVFVYLPLGVVVLAWLFTVINPLWIGSILVAGLIGVLLARQVVRRRMRLRQGK